MSNPTGLGIDFAAIAGAETSAPAGASESALVKVDLNKPLEQFSCRTALSATERMQLEAASAQLLVLFKKDRAQLSAFGDGALDDLNATVAHILREQGKLRIPEVEKMTKEMAFVIKDFRRKYRNDDPKLLEALEKFADSVKGIFRAGKDFFDRLYIDSQSAVERLDGVAKKLIEHKGVLDRNVFLADELYEKNEVALLKLQGVIALMEQILELMHAEAVTKKQELDSMPAGQSPERRKKEEELNLHLEMIEELEVRRSEFVQRLFVGFSTAPQIRNLRKVSNSLSQRLQLLVSLTIPTMKLTIAQWGMMLQMDKAGKAIETVNDLNNDVLQGYAQATGEAIPRLALLSQTPSTTPTTIMVLAESIQTQHEGMVHAIEEGQRMRAELDHTVVQAIDLMSKSGTKYQTRVIELVGRTQHSKPLELEAAPEIPEVVVEYAQTQGVAA